MTRIYTDSNGVATNAISKLSSGADVEGHLYQVLAGTWFTELYFQHGPVKEVGVNGLTSEALLAALIHRLKFLDGKFPCEENKTALAGLQTAFDAMEARTKNRIERGVEGQNKA